LFMPRSINPKTIASMIQKLQTERARAQERVEQIDSIFQQCGITGPAEPARRGPGRPRKNASTPAGAAPSTNGRRGRRGRRGRFPTSGTESLLNLVRGTGRGGVSSADITKHWKGEGRSGQPFITLGQLVKSGRLKRKGLKGQRGS